MAEEKRKFALDLRLPRRNYVGVFFSLVGFILTLLCVVGCRTTHGEKLYFAKISESPAGNLTLYIGWQGYCVQDGQSISCHDDDGVMMMPFGKKNKDRRSKQGVYFLFSHSDDMHYY